MWFIIGCFIIVFMGAATAAYMVKMKEEFEKFKNKYTNTQPDMDSMLDSKDKDYVEKEGSFVPDEPVVAEIKDKPYIKDEPLEDVNMAIMDRYHLNENRKWSQEDLDYIMKRDENGKYAHKMLECTRKLQRSETSIKSMRNKLNKEKK